MVGDEGGLARVSLSGDGDLPRGRLDGLLDGAVGLVAVGHGAADAAGEEGAAPAVEGRAGAELGVVFRGRGGLEPEALDDLEILEDGLLL